MSLIHRHLLPVLLAVFALAAVALSPNAASADTMIYLGVGEPDAATDETVDDVPFSGGVLYFPPASILGFGADIGREGAFQDSTFGEERLRQATSINALVGANVVDTGRLRLDAAAVLGARERFADCADSNLGFRCFADTDPEFEYDFNYGALLLFSVEFVSFGVRVTDASAQLVFGVRF